jgi:hypothetical protein
MHVVRKCTVLLSDMQGRAASQFLWKPCISDSDTEC